jgi:hypothetical protein
MKKLFFVLVLVMCTVIVMGQKLQKDNVYSHWVLEVTLKPGATMDQFLEVIYNDYLPALREAFPDVNFVFLEGIRGEHDARFGLLSIFENEEGLRKYWPEKGQASDLYRERFEIVKPTREKMKLYADYDWLIYTGWKVLNNQ